MSRNIPRQGICVKIVKPFGQARRAGFITLHFREVSDWWEQLRSISGVCQRLGNHGISKPLHNYHWMASELSACEVPNFEACLFVHTVYKACGWPVQCTSIEAQIVSMGDQQSSWRKLWEGLKRQLCKHTQTGPKNCQRPKWCEFSWYGVRYVFGAVFHENMQDQSVSALLCKKNLLLQHRLLRSPTLG